MFCFRFEASYEQDTDVSIQEHIDLLSSEVESIQKNQEETLKAVRQIMATKQTMLIVEVPRGRKQTYVPVEVHIRHYHTAWQPEVYTLHQNHIVEDTTQNLLYSRWKSDELKLTILLWWITLSLQDITVFWLT